MEENNSNQKIEISSFQYGNVFSKLGENKEATPDKAEGTGTSVPNVATVQSGHMERSGEPQTLHSSGARSAVNSRKGIKSTLMKIAITPVLLAALVGLFILGGKILNAKSEQAVIADKDTFVCDSDSTVMTELAMSEPDERSEMPGGADTSEENVIPTADVMEAKTDPTEVIAEYRKKHLKLNSVYIQAAVFFDIKASFEALPADIRASMPKEGKQIEYYNMFFTAKSPADIRPLKTYAKSYFTAEQVWMIERTYLYSEKRFYDVYNKEGMSFAGARKIFLEKKWNRR